uniref:SNF2_N domain-containing protein n=1 Tax=Macrostomum lignano TaxID=282301 RepID=A0A1I8F816_9PLAT
TAERRAEARPPPLSPDVAEPAEASVASTAAVSSTDSSHANQQRKRRRQRRATASTSVSKKRSRPTDDDDSFTSAASRGNNSAETDQATRRAADNPAKPKTEPQPVAQNRKCNAETQEEPAGWTCVHRQLRDYQLEGFNWLGGMYEKLRINGILGDEMGLGKDRAVHRSSPPPGPHGRHRPVLRGGRPLFHPVQLAAEFARFAPAVPVVLYHGNKDRCVPCLRNEMRNPLPVAGCNTPAANRRYEWKLLIVDEGHSVEEFPVPAGSRAAHHNNLTELWSLLNFLLPEIFEKLGTFEAWFDARRTGRTPRARSAGLLEQGEGAAQVLSAMQQILLPFMLRRCKADVDSGGAAEARAAAVRPIMRAGAAGALNRMAVDRTIEKLLDGDNRGRRHVGGHRRGSHERGPRQAKVRRRCDLPPDAQLALSDETKTPAGVKAKLDDDDDEDDARCWRRERRKAARAKAGVSSAALTPAHGLPISTLSTLGARLRATVAGRGSPPSVHINLRNPMALLKRICNHPYLVRYPLTRTASTGWTNRLVSVSGKFRLLDRLLPAELQRQGRKGADL